MLLDVICPHCEREHYASNARLIQPLTSICAATSEQSLIALQTSVTPLEETDIGTPEAGYLNPSAQAGIVGLVRASTIVSETPFQPSITIPELGLSHSSNLASSPSLSDLLSTTSPTTSEDNVSLQVSGGRNTIHHLTQSLQPLPDFHDCSAKLQSPQSSRGLDIAGLPMQGSF